MRNLAAPIDSHASPIHFRPRHARIRPAALVGAVAALAMTPAFAGAPFLTDDPGTPEQGEFEFTLAAIYSQSRTEREGELPSLEIEYGLLSNLQLSIAPALSFFHERNAGKSANYGFGDLEIAMKYRFIEDDEHSWIPAVAFAPALSLPSGDSNRELGSGFTNVTLPLWLSKEIGEWTIATGASYNINHGDENKNFWFTGVLLTYALSDALTVGGEIYHRTPQEVDGKSSTGFNLGLVYSLAEGHELLFSAGRNLINADENNQFSGYLGYRIGF